MTLNTDKLRSAGEGGRNEEGRDGTPLKSERVMRLTGNAERREGDLIIQSSNTRWRKMSGKERVVGYGHGGRVPHSAPKPICVTIGVLGSNILLPTSSSE